MSSFQDCQWRDRVILAATEEEPETRELKDHMAECADCRRLYLDLERLERIQIPTPQVPEEIHQRILAAARVEAAEKQRKPISWFTWATKSVPRLAWAAVFLLAVGISFWQYMRYESQVTPPFSEEMDYRLAIVEMDLQALESEMELSSLDMS